MNNKFHKSKTDKKFGGVCAGIAETLDLDITLVRIAAFFLCLFYPTALILYLILAVFLPTDINTADTENAPSKIQSSYSIKQTCIQALLVGLIGALCGGIIYKKLFLFNVGFIDLFGFMVLAIGLFLFISGLTESENANIKITKTTLGSIFSFIAITKITRILTIDFLPIDHIIHSVSYLWPVLIICLGITVVVPKKRTAIIIWLTAALIILLYTFTKLLNIPF